MHKLRIKMIAVSVAAVIFVFSLMTLIITFSLRAYNIRQADTMTQIISTFNGAVPANLEVLEESDDLQYPLGFRFNEESAFRTRFFLVYLDENGDPESADIKHIASISEALSFEYAQTVLDMNEEVGYCGDFRFRVSETDDSTMLVFLDCTDSFASLQMAQIMIFAVFMLFLFLLSIVFAVCSKYVLQPFMENNRKQKQFITDASHELKTPLAVISANAEVLEFKEGGNQWTETILHEVQHMNGMIADLLTLSKLEELDDRIDVREVDLAKTVRETAEKFREVAARKNADLLIDVPEQLPIHANAELMTQLVSILTENASKYVSENGEIRVSAALNGKRAVLKVYNTAEFAEPIDCEKLFDRFYRTDSSRTSKTGGQGIGLSIAKRITTLHGGTISAAQTKNGICFTASINAQLKLRETQKKRRS